MTEATTPTLSRETERAKEGKREAWKNRWLATEAFIGGCDVCGREEVVQAGEEITSCCKVWPTRAAAERGAAESLAKYNSHAYQKYLGPIRIESAP